ncbi:hypothetical protein GTW30_23355 [Streptomyces sp. SID7810]|nr:hypothetical protein [Streptomyces sp. SID7810]
MRAHVRARATVLGSSGRGGETCTRPRVPRCCPPWQSPRRYGDDGRRRVYAVAGFRQAGPLP